jgi:hypothetical protein
MKYNCVHKLLVIDVSTCTLKPFFEKIKKSVASCSDWRQGWTTLVCNMQICLEKNHLFANLVREGMLSELIRRQLVDLVIDHGKSDELDSGPNLKKVARFKKLENSSL